MKLAIMQPYFFPYIGYFQLICAVDVFILYDDVQFIKQGWIGRNNFLISGIKKMIAIPLSELSSNKLIMHTYINREKYGLWREKFFRSLEQSYSKAPFKEKVIGLIKDVFWNIEFPKSIAEFNHEGIIAVAQYIGINTIIYKSSEKYNNAYLTGSMRIIDICKLENANTYINAMGGTSLYQKETFKSFGIQLQFLKSKDIFYKQNCPEFIPWLSILDIMMHNSPETIGELLNEYELL